MSHASTIVYDPYDYAIDADPHPIWKRMRDDAPVYWNEKYQFWALSRFADVYEASRDIETFSSARGTVLEMEAFFDNSSANSKNPNNPPRDVRDGPYTTDEMCKCHIDVITDHPSDRSLLIREMRQTIFLRLRELDRR